jgi:hypothetical protein
MKTLAWLRARTSTHCASASAAQRAGRQACRKRARPSKHRSDAPRREHGPSPGGSELSRNIVARRRRCRARAPWPGSPPGEAQAAVQRLVWSAASPPQAVTLVGPPSRWSSSAPRRFVSRGGAGRGDRPIRHQVAGRRCLDTGASTGDSPTACSLVARVTSWPSTSVRPAGGPSGTTSVSRSGGTIRAEPRRSPYASDRWLRTCPSSRSSSWCRCSPACRAADLVLLMTAVRGGTRGCRARGGRPRRGRVGSLHR